MANERKNNKQNSTKSSKLQTTTNLTNEELLENILNKKKTKKSNKTTKLEKEVLNKENQKEEIVKNEDNEKKVSSKAESQTEKKKSTTKTTKKTNKKTKKPAPSDISADELLNSIVAKKKKCASKKDTAQLEIHENREDTPDSDNATAQPEKPDSKNILTKEQKSAEKESVNKDELINNYEGGKEQLTSESDEKVSLNKENEEDKSDTKDTTLKSEKEKNLDDLIITRKITFDDEKINLKSKKTLAELRKAIEEFDRLETLSEIESSSAKINDQNNELIDLVEEEKSQKESRNLFKTSMLVFGKRTQRIYGESEEENLESQKILDEDEQESLDTKEKLDSTDSLDLTTKIFKGLSNKLKSSNAEKEQTDEFDYLRSLGDFESEEVRPPSSKRKLYVDKREKNAFILLISCLVLFLLLILILFIYLNNNKVTHASTIEPKVIDVMAANQTEEEQIKEYTECLHAPFSEKDNTKEFADKVVEFDVFLDENYNAAVAFENLATGYVYNYHPQEIYYAASTIKALDALYIYTGAANGEIDLDEKIEYSAKHKISSSKGMSQHKFGDLVSLRDLVKYAVIYSDNSAHQMLIEYIGKSALREFGQSLGATTTLTGADNFGNINVTDALIYMKAINEFIKNNPSLGSELREFFVSAEQNDLAIPELGITAAHKYGSYSYYYHDYGIVYAESPYVVAILTTEGQGDYESKVKDINLRIYELNKLLTEIREIRCQIAVYGK